MSFSAVLTTRITRFTKLYWTRLSLLIHVVGFLGALLSSETVDAQSYIKISGSVIDKATKAPVPYVHIYTRSWERGTTTNEQGHFSIIIDRADTLIFSSIGFEKYRLHLTDDDSRSVFHVIIEMDSRTYELEPVVVHAYMSFEEFKKEILDLNIPAEKKALDLNIPPGYKPPRENRDGSMLNPSISLNGPVSALYNALSKEGREKRSLESYRVKRTNEKIVEAKYNLDVVKRITQLAEDDAKHFMEWCKFEDDFILQASDYDLAVAMLKCLDEFHKSDSIR